MEPSAGTCIEDTLLFGMFRENSQAGDNWQGREAPSTHIHLPRLLHSFSPDRKKPQHKVAGRKVRLQYPDAKVEVRKQICEAVQILSITVPLSAYTQFKLIKQVGKIMYISKILFLLTPFSPYSDFSGTAVV